MKDQPLLSSFENGKNGHHTNGILSKSSSLQEKPKYNLSDCRITSRTHVLDIEPTIMIGESIFAIKGDISYVTGLPKAGKSAISVFLLGTALMRTIPQELDTLQIRTAYCHRRPVVYIDTEQPKPFTKKLLNSIKSFIEQEVEPDHLYIYNLRVYELAERLERVKAMFEAHPDAHLWVIDGIADLVSDPNDAKESFKITSTFMQLAESHQTTIVLYLHENPGSGKARGHLGSEGERKCGGAITVKKDRAKGVHSIEARMIRGASDFPEIFFKYDTTKGRMASLGKAEAEEVKQNRENDFERKAALMDTAQACFPDPSESISYSELLTRIMEKDRKGKGASDRTGRTRIADMTFFGVVLKNELTGKYTLAQPG
jgi:hypothetical protein